jgi:hypothetical protein
MQKRKFTFGDYDTAAAGWTLTGWKLSAAEQKVNYVEKQGGDGSWDLSTALTDGIPIYRHRTLVATFECSEGDRLSREAKIREMVNQLDGMRENIELPDDSLHYMTGRLHIAKDYNDPAHAAVTVSATCDPWKYSNAETAITLTATTAKQSATIINNGRRAVIPTLKVEGSGASVVLEYGTASKTLAAGVYQWPELLLTPGGHKLTYSGSGKLVITYREAVLE